MRSFLLTLTLIAFASPAYALEGKPTVIDAGTIAIGAERIRLFGIAAPSERDTCAGTQGEAWNCGQQASWALAFTLAEHWVNCAPQSRVSDSLVATCTMGGSHDIAETLLRQGWARTDAQAPPAYKSAEDAARKARVGLWR